MNNDSNLVVMDPPAPLATLAPPTIEQTLAVAVERGMDPAGLEKLAAIYEREQARRAEKSFIEALAAFRAECPAIVKNRDAIDPKNNNRLLYRFVDLSEITKLVDRVLLRHGLTYTWDTDVQAEQTVVTCTLFHTDGHKRTSKFTCRASGTSIMSDAQKSASAVTFGRRYTLTGVLGLTVDEDDDGRRLAEPNPQPPADPTAPKVGTREEGHQQQPADGVPRVTRMMLSNLFAGWHAKHPDEPKTVEAFAAWIVETLKLECAPVTLTNVNGWSIDLVASVREVLNGER